MTIDEKIEQLKIYGEEMKRKALLFRTNKNNKAILEIAEGYLTEAQWLEELKTYRQGRINTIDEFTDKLLKQEVIDKSVIRRISEQMKEVQNEET